MVCCSNAALMEWIRGSFLLQLPPASLNLVLEKLSSREPEFDIALLVLSSTSPSSSFDEIEIDTEAWEDLSLNHGFELIDLNDPPSKPSQEEAEVEEGGEGTEFGGLKRVVEALHAHMWEGMRVLPRPSGSGSRNLEAARNAAAHEDDDEGENGTSAGVRGIAPPLPAPRPFVPTPMVFPSTFLPSLKGGASSFVRDSTAPSLPSPFDDDFTPFALPLSVPAFPPITLPSPPLPRTEGLYRDLELFPPGSEMKSGKQHDEEEEGGDDELEELVTKLMGMRGELEGVGMEERRERAEKLIAGLVGDDNPFDEEEEPVNLN